MSTSILKYAAKAEEWLLAAMLATMIILACTQIFLRALFSGGLLWIDPVLRYLVLWSGFIGAAMATSRGKHIALDLISYLVPEPAKSYLAIITNIFSMVVCGFLTWAATLFLMDEFQYGGSGPLEIPSWAWNVIFPLAFFLITLRFGSLAISSLLSIFKGTQPGENN